MNQSSFYHKFELRFVFHKTCNQTDSFPVDLKIVKTKKLFFLSLWTNKRNMNCLIPTSTRTPKCYSHSLKMSANVTKLRDSIKLNHNYSGDFFDKKVILPILPQFISFYQNLFTSFYLIWLIPKKTHYWHTYCSKYFKAVGLRLRHYISFNL